MGGGRSRRRRWLRWSTYNPFVTRFPGTIHLPGKLVFPDSTEGFKVIATWNLLDRGIHVDKHNRDGGRNRSGSRERFRLQARGSLKGTGRLSRRNHLVITAGRALLPSLAWSSDLQRRTVGGSPRQTSLIPGQPKHPQGIGWSGDRGVCHQQKHAEGGSSDQDPRPSAASEHGGGPRGTAAGAGVSDGNGTSGWSPGRW